MILACHNICKSFGTDDILRNVSFHIEEHEKAAVVGINGAGKSTLLKIIVSETDADSGEVTVARGKTVGYLAQQNMLSGNQSIYDEVAMVKQDVIDLEQRLRDLEREMDEADSGQLEAIMDQYHMTQTRLISITGRRPASNRKADTPGKARSPAYSGDWGFRTRSLTSL